MRPRDVVTVTQGAEKGSGATGRGGDPGDRTVEADTEPSPQSGGRVGQMTTADTEFKWRRVNIGQILQTLSGTLAPLWNLPRGARRFALSCVTRVCGTARAGCGDCGPPGLGVS